MTKQKQPPQQPRDSVLMTIPEAAAYSGWTVFKIRTLCQSGMLRYSQEGHPFLITREAMRDWIVLTEAKMKAKREAKLAKLARKKPERGNLPKTPAHRSPCGLPGCLTCEAFERGRQRARELRLISNG
jgi:hypothetical protein